MIMNVNRFEQSTRKLQSDRLRTDSRAAANNGFAAMPADG